MEQRGYTLSEVKQLELVAADSAQINQIGKPVNTTRAHFLACLESFHAQTPNPEDTRAVTTREKGIAEATKMLARFYGDNGVAIVFGLFLEKKELREQVAKDRKSKTQSGFSWQIRTAPHR